MSLGVEKSVSGGYKYVCTYKTASNYVLIYEKALENIEKPYVIAEIGANHNGDIILAKKMIETAKECGADAVKFQHFDVSNLCTADNLNDLDSGAVKLENVDDFSTPELGLNNVKPGYIRISKKKWSFDYHYDCLNLLLVQLC